MRPVTDEMIVRFVEVAQTTMTDGDGAARRRRTDMKRLTTTNEHGKPVLKALPNYEEYDPVCRLFAYEDTGLEPEEIIELKARMEGLEK